MEALAGEELTSAGEGSGVEREQPDPVVTRIATPFDPDQIDVATRNMTVNLLLSRIRAGAIDLQPDFQRRAGIWTDQKQSQLIESMLLRIPLPTLYAAEDERGKWAIVDGIQRLTAIARFVEPEVISADPLHLSGLEYLGQDRGSEHTSLDGTRYAQLPEALKRRLQETELVVHVIRSGTPEEVKFNIFGRINTGGMPLSSQELRHALVPGAARSVLREWAASEVFKRATNHSIRDERMADRELVLRFVAFRLTPYQLYDNSNVDAFLRRAMRAINQLSEAEVTRLRAEFEKAMTGAWDVFGNDAFRKRYAEREGRRPINKALFESISACLASLSEAQIAKLVERKSEVRTAFIALMGDKEFDKAISQGTGDIQKVKRRFEEIEKMLGGVAR